MKTEKTDHNLIELDSLEIIIKLKGHCIDDTINCMKCYFRACDEESPFICLLHNGPTLTPSLIMDNATKLLDKHRLKVKSMIPVKDSERTRRHFSLNRRHA